MCRTNCGERHMNNDIVEEGLGSLVYTPILVSHKHLVVSGYQIKRRQQTWLSKGVYKEKRVFVYQFPKDYIFKIQFPSPNPSLQNK